MARPALSGTRALQILDTLAGSPEKGFSLSALVRSTGFNFASCHAVLTALVARAYLVRDDTQKTYRLGPALFAAGQAMAMHDPILLPMQAAADALAMRTRLQVAIAARAGDEMVGISRHGDALSGGQGLRIGQRVPLKTPIGATLMAWPDDSDIDSWMMRGGIRVDSEEAAAMRVDLAAIRRRGYLATLSSDSYAAISSAVAQRNRKEDSQSRKGKLVIGLYGGLFQPEKIDPDATYDLAYIGSSIFDRSGRPLYSLILSGFCGQISGAAIEACATELTRMCTDVVRLSAGR